MRLPLLLSFFLAATAESAVPPAYGHTPVRFEPNQGQADPRVLFLTRDNGVPVYLTRSEVDFVMSESSGRNRIMRMKLGSSVDPARIWGEERLTGHSNYLIGSDPGGWHTDVPHFARVRYRELYPGIDMVYYSRESRLEYDFVVSPGADAGLIHMEYEGTHPPRIDKNGDLVLRLPGGSVYQRRPVAYQMVGGLRREVSARYVLKGRRVTIQPGDYDRAKELILDPVISYSSFLGGSAGDRGTAIAVDGQGNAYVTGTTASANFPNVNAYQTTLLGGDDCFVTKINAAGTAILYSTFIGGTQTISGFGHDHGMGIYVDSAGNAIVAGTTDSSNFPTTAGAFQRTYGGVFGDGFVFKLNAAGNGLIFSTFLGGKDTDEIYGLAVNASGIYVAGVTASKDFPLQNAIQTSLKGTRNAFVTKLDPTGAFLVYSTYLGGSQQDWAYDIAVDTAGNAFVTGETQSPDFPVLNAYQAAKSSTGSGSDAFLTKLQPAGTMVFSTFLGGAGTDQGFGVALDPGGNIYVAGETGSNNFPTTPGAYQRTFGGFSDAFVTKFTPSGTQLVYSTYLGGALTDGAFALAVDSLGQAHITGRTWSDNAHNFPLVNAFQPIYGGAFTDGFVAKFSAGGDSLIYSSYLGGKNEDNSDNNAGFLGVGGVAIDSSGNAYYTGRTDSENYPTTPGVFQPVFGGRTFPVGDDNAFDAFVIKIGGGGTTGGGGLRFVPVPPCRISDTRGAIGPFGGPRMTTGETRSIAIPGSACGIPASAQAYSLNVTVVPAGPLGYLSLWPAGQAQPLVSTLNSGDGRIKANAALVPAGSNGSVSVFVTDPTDVILDINGYFLPASASAGLSFYPVAPCRVADTRNPAGPLGGPSLGAGQSRTLPVQSACSLPAGAQAYSFNVTAVPLGPLGYLTIWPAGQGQPLVSTLNSPTGTVVANAAIVPAGANGSISVFATNAMDLVIDVDGYFAAPGNPGALSLYAVTPCRVLDTRTAAGPFGGPAMGGGTSRSFAIPASTCSIPASAQGYSLNTTVVPAGPLGYLTLWPTGQAQPFVSTLNSLDGAIASNAAIVPAGASLFGGAASVFVTNTTNVILDINGYFAP